MGFEFSTQTLSLADCVALTHRISKKRSSLVEFWTPLGLPAEPHYWFRGPKRKSFRLSFPVCRPPLVTTSRSRVTVGRPRSRTSPIPPAIERSDNSGEEESCSGSGHLLLAQLRWPVGDQGERLCSLGHALRHNEEFLSVGSDIVRSTNCDTPTRLKQR